MRRFTAIFITAISLLSFASCHAHANCSSSALTQEPGDNDIVIPYNMISQTGSFNQFMQASEMNQYEILLYFMQEAQKEYNALDEKVRNAVKEGIDEVRTKELLSEVYDFRDKIDIIKKRYYGNARQQNISFDSIMNKLRRLDNDLEGLLKKCPFPDPIPVPGAM